MKIQTAPTQSFSDYAPLFNYRISLDTKGPLNPPSQHKSYIHVIVDALSHFVVTVPIKSNNAKTAVKTLLHHWITKYGPPIYLVTDRGSEYGNKDKAHLCTLMGIRHSPRTAYSPWQMAWLKYKIEISAHTFVCFFIIPLKIGLFKYICILTHTIPNQFQKCFSLRNSVSHKTQNSIDIHTMTKQI